MNMLSPTRAALLATAIACLWAAAPAGAATMHRTPSGHIAFTAARGETNSVTIRRVSRKTYVVRDSTAPIVAGAGCDRRGRHAVDCKNPEELFFVYLRDGDDTFRGSATVFAGSGDDIVRGKKASESLSGGRGSDELYGGRGDDFLEDGVGPGSAPGKDKLDGGAGEDEVSYTRHGKRPIRIDLSAGRGLGRDRLIGIETVNTARGDDTVTGDGANNQLWAGSGKNTLRGLGGNDLLDSAGGGSLSGGGGDDEIEATSNVADPTQIDCGSGNDLVISYPGDELTSDCEKAFAQKVYVWLQTLTVTEEGAARFRLSCPSLYSDCEGRLELRREDGSLASRARYLILDEGFVEFPLDQSTTDLLAAGARFTVTGPGDTRGFTTLLQAETEG